jgi:hypothetical protein
VEGYSLVKPKGAKIAKPRIRITKPKSAPKKKTIFKTNVDTGKDTNPPQTREEENVDVVINNISNKKAKSKHKRFGFVFNKTNIRNFNDRFRELCLRVSNRNIILQKITDIDNNENYKVVELKNRKNRLLYKDVLKSDFPWELINPNCKVSREVFTKFIKNEKEFVRFMGKHSESKKEDNNGKSNETQIVDLNNYCYCRQPYKHGLDMFECVNGSTCKLGGWFHKKCCEELLRKKVTWAQIKDKNFQYTCKECLKAQNLNK